jgi:hypothetical protein
MVGLVGEQVAGDLAGQLRGIVAMVALVLLVGEARASHRGDGRR